MRGEFTKAIDMAVKAPLRGFGGDSGVYASTAYGSKAIEQDAPLVAAPVFQQSPEQFHRVCNWLHLLLF